MVTMKFLASFRLRVFLVSWGGIPFTKLKSLTVVSRDFSQLFEKSSASSSSNSTPFFWQARNLSRKENSILLQDPQSCNRLSKQGFSRGFLVVDCKLEQKKTSKGRNSTNFAFDTLHSTVTVGCYLSVLSVLFCKLFHPNYVSE